MRYIGSLASEEQAKTLEDYLLTVEIPSKVLHGSNGWELWVHDEDRRDRAQEVFEQFQAAPNDAKYATAASRARKLRREAEREEKKRQKNFVDLRQRWQPVSGSRPLTFLLIIASILVTVTSNFGKEWEPVRNRVEMTAVRNGMYAPSLPEIRSGEVWRLVTPVFLHFGILHLFFDMYILLFFAGMIEVRRGTVRLALLVLASAVASNLAQYLNVEWLWYVIGRGRFSVGGPGFGGMSGVDYALFGYVWMKSRYDVGSGLYVRSDTVVMLIGWFFLCMTGLVGDIANVAHGVGLAVGVAVGIAPYAWRKLVGR